MGHGKSRLRKKVWRLMMRREDALDLSMWSVGVNPIAAGLRFGIVRDMLWCCSPSPPLCPLSLVSTTIFYIFFCC